MKKKIKLWSTKKIPLWIRIAIALGAALLFFVFSYFDTPIKNLNEDFCDFIYQSGTGSQLPVYIIGIDDETLERLGLPATWNREIYSQFLDNIYADNAMPSAVGFDILFTGHTGENGALSEGDKAMLETVEKYPHIVSGVHVVFGENTYKDENGDLEQDKLYAKMTAYPFEELKNIVKLGTVDPFPNEDGYIRTVYTGIKNEKGEELDSLAYAVLKEYKSSINDENRNFSDAEIAMIENIPDYADTCGKMYKFAYAKKNDEFEYLSFYNVYMGEDNDGHKLSGRFENAIVLIGAYAPGLSDDFFVPMSTGQKMYGVEIHANMMTALAAGNIQTRPENMFLYSVIMSVIVGIVTFALMYFSMGIEIILSIVCCSIYTHFCIEMFDRKIYLDLLYFLIAMAILDIGYVVYHYLAEYLSKQKINKAFRMYVAPEIVEEVSRDKNFELQLGGRNKDIAVLFVDIRGFTTMSESLKPDEVVDILNEYFDVITTAIFDNKGTLDKFIGDAAMAVFNSPFDLEDYVFRAVKAAQDIAKGSVELSERLKEKFGRTVSYGIGVNCGEATIGNIGSKFRMDYTAIGDTVNTASRLESNAKAGEILISNEVKERLGDRITTEPVGEIPLKGKKVGIFVHRVVGITDEEDQRKEVPLEE